MDDVIYEEFKGTGNLELHLIVHLPKEEFSLRLIFVAQVRAKKSYPARRSRRTRSRTPSTGSRTGWRRAVRPPRAGSRCPRCAAGWSGACPGARSAPSSSPSAARSPHHSGARRAHRAGRPDRARRPGLVWLRPRAAARAPVRSGGLRSPRGRPRVAVAPVAHRWHRMRPPTGLSSRLLHLCVRRLCNRSVALGLSARRIRDQRGGQRGHRPHETVLVHAGRVPTKQVSQQPVLCRRALQDHGNRCPIDGPVPVTSQLGEHVRGSPWNRLISPSPNRCSSSGKEPSPRNSSRLRSRSSSNRRNPAVVAADSRSVTPGQACDTIPSARSRPSPSSRSNPSVSRDSLERKCL